MTGSLVEAVADLVRQRESSGMCHYGRECALCDCDQPRYDHEAMELAQAVMDEFEVELAKTIKEAQRVAWERGFDSAELQDVGMLHASGWIRNNPYKETP